ncbi:RpiR family transcriptional regulator [Synergistales bacterium]|nr:RpiR family transcriptional regulator [Synergistales bacterium]
MDLQDALREYLTKTKGAKHLVAKFLLTNFDDIPVLTLEDVSLKIKVSLSTITRTTAELGFHGFPDFQKQVWTSIKPRLSPSARMGLKAPKISEQVMPNESFRHDIENVVQASNLNPEHAFNEAASLIAKASRVYVLGIRTASTLSSFFFYGLAKIRSYVCNLDASSTSLIEHFPEMDRDSVLFAATFPRYTKYTVEAAQETCKRGGSVVSLTDSPSSPLAPYSKVILYAPYDSLSFFNSMVAPLSVLNVLIIKINVILGQTGEKHLIQYENLLDEWGAILASQNKQKKLS